MKIRNCLLTTLSLVVCLFGLGFAGGHATAAVVDPLQTFCSTKASSTTHVCQERAANTGTTNPAIKALKLTINIMSVIVGATAVIVIILGGLSMVTSGGDAQSVAKARQAIIYALIGVVTVVFSQIIVVFVLNRI